LCQNENISKFPLDHRSIYDSITGHIWIFGIYLTFVNNYELFWSIEKLGLNVVEKLLRQIKKITYAQVI